ncbi:MAG: TRAP transporter substrate-binding protein DctP [Burkholderiales bacterium]
MKKLVAVAALGAVLGAPIAFAQEVTLRAAVFVPVNTTFGELFGRYVDYVNQTGKGTLQIRLVGGPDAVPPFEQGNAVRTGVLDMASLPPAFYVNTMPEADVAILTRQTFQEQRKSGAWDALNKAHNQRMNAWLLGGYAEGVEFHVFTNKPVKTIADLKGLKLRTTPNYTPFFQTLGATLVNTAPGEVQTALERGVVDGYGWPMVGIFDLGWAQHTKYRIDPGFYNVVVNVLVNLPKWNSLNPAQKAVLTKSAEWLDAENRTFVQTKIVSERRRQAEGNIQPIDLGPNFRMQAYDAYWAQIEKRAPEQVKALRPLYDK